MMVSDRRRTDAFAEAIAEVVKPGDVVIDVGTGTGILAMLAARAGAARTHAVDKSLVIEHVQALLEDNALSELVTLHHSLASDLIVEGRADLIISEWLGNFALVEDMLKDVLYVRDRYLKPGGRMLPSHVDVMLAPIDDRILYDEEGPGFWREPIHGLDFSRLEKLELAQQKSQKMRIEESFLLAPGQTLVSLDLLTMKPGDEWVEGVLEFEATRDGTLDGFAGWFTAQLSPGVLLDTGPGSPWTHWSQIYMPFPPRPTRAKEKLRVKYALRPAPEYRGAFEVNVSVDGKSLSYLIE
jgi:hypothetical protein